MRVAMGDRDGRDPDSGVFKNLDRTSRVVSNRRQNRDVDGLHEEVRVRHVTVQGHDVEVVGESRQDVFNEVSRTREWFFWMDYREPAEGVITHWRDCRGAGTVHANRRK